MQRLGDFLRQEVLAIQGHDLADFDHATLQFAQFIHQEPRLARKHGSVAFIAVFPAAEPVGCHVGSHTGTGKQPGTSQTQPALETACLDAGNRIS
jgi:hypothetical protein